MMAWDTDPNLYASPYRSLIDGARALLHGEPAPLVAREWRGVVRPEDADSYLGYLHRTGLADYAATPGHRGTVVMRAPLTKGVEFTLVTFWSSVDAIRAFAGDDPTRARYYPEDEGYLLDRPERVRHYDVPVVARIG